AEGGPPLSAGRVVMLVEPAAGAEFTALARIPFLAATDPAGPDPVTLQLLVNEEGVLTLTNAFAGAWSNVMAGNYQLAVRAVFSDGSTAASAPLPVTVKLSPDELPPRFTQVFPADQSTWVVPVDLRLAVQVSDPSPQGRIIDFRVFADGRLLAVRT